MWLFTLISALNINTISIPYDNGANIKGSRFAPKIIVDNLDNLDNLQICNNYEIQTNKIIKNYYEDTFILVAQSIDKNFFPIILGGDHSVVVPGISAINEYYKKIQNKSLGVLWVDAHADFNTIDTSPSKNFHGMPVSILCHHTLPNLNVGDTLDPSQFGFYGVRDIDSLEFNRFQNYNMQILDSDIEINEWLKNFDKIHVSFDIDCIDPYEFNGVNTPVKNGKKIKEIKSLFNKIKKSKKLCSLDIVEYNPEKNNNVNIITDIVKEIF